MPWLRLRTPDDPPASAAEIAFIRLELLRRRIHEQIDRECEREAARDRVRFFALRHQISERRRQIAAEFYAVRARTRLDFLRPLPPEYDPRYGYAHRRP